MNFLLTSNDIQVSKSCLNPVDDFAFYSFRHVMWCMNGSTGSQKEGQGADFHDFERNHCLANASNHKLLKPEKQQGSHTQHITAEETHTSIA